MRIWVGFFFIVVMSLTVGCEDVFDADSDEGKEDMAAVEPAADGGEEADGASSDGPAATATSVSASSAGVTWLNSDVSGWAQTATLSGVRISGDSITLNYDKTRVWPSGTPLSSDTPLNANAWIFVNQGGKWYAATWEWMRPGQITKSKSAVNGGHINQAPLQNFSPKSGEVYGFMVSGLARSSVRNVKERSNVVMVRWP